MFVYIKALLVKGILNHSSIGNCRFVRTDFLSSSFAREAEIEEDSLSLVFL